MTMFIARKARADAKLEQLRTDQRERLIGWLGRENRTYAEARALVQSEFGLTVEKTALGTFWRGYVLPQRLWEEAKAESPQVDLPESAFPETVAKLARRQMIASLGGLEPDVTTVRRLMTVVNATERLTLGRRNAELEDRRMVVLETREKIRAVKAAIKEMDRPMSKEEKHQRIQELLDMGEWPASVPPNSPLLPPSAAITDEAENDAPDATERRGD